MSERNRFTYTPKHHLNNLLEKYYSYDTYDKKRRKIYDIIVKRGECIINKYKKKYPKENLPHFNYILYLVIENFKDIPNDYIKIPYFTIRYGDRSKIQDIIDEIKYELMIKDVIKIQSYVRQKLAYRRYQRLKIFEELRYLPGIGIDYQQYKEHFNSQK